MRGILITFSLMRLLKTGMRLMPAIVYSGRSVSDVRTAALTFRQAAIESLQNDDRCPISMKKRQSHFRLCPFSC